MLDSKILALTLSALIVGVESQASCDSSSPDCCWVVRSWQLMGKTTSVSSTSRTACCSMPGVTCSDTLVTKIDWYYSGLKNSIPEDIGKLTNLKDLRIAFNYGLTGTIPSSIGKLINLEFLALYSNKFLNGSIPSEIGNLKSLKQLLIGDNRFSGPIPSSIGNLTNLTWLGLSNNLLNGSIPESFVNLNRLVLLFLNGNQLSGSIPASIGNLKSLTNLNIDKNQLNGSIPASIGNLLNLTGLTLGYNQLSGSIPPSIGNLLNLTRLDLRYNKLSGSIPSGIGNFSYLIRMDVSNNPGLSGTFTPNFGLIVALNTSVTVCTSGSARSLSIPSLFPSVTTASRECLAVSNTSSLVKRILTYSQNIAGIPYSYICSIDSVTLNPFQDCFSAMAGLCNPGDLRANTGLIPICKTSVDQMVSQMGPLWQTVRQRCGSYSTSYFTAASGSNSVDCRIALSNLETGAKYTVKNPPERYIVNIDRKFTDSMNTTLWNNPHLLR